MNLEDHMTEMQRYRDFRPTGHDAVGLGCADRQDWIVAPVSITRDTRDYDVDRVNWATMIADFETADSEGADHEIHRFGHWGPGWFEIVLVRPDSACHRIAAECMCALANYPILDDDSHSMAEFEAACDAWERANLRDRIETCMQASISMFAARCDEMPDDDQGAVRDYLLGYTGSGGMSEHYLRHSGLDLTADAFAASRKR